jgi:hypothetical protein
MNKREFKALGRLFYADCIAELVQSKEEIFTRLEGLNYCYKDRKSLRDFPLIEVLGWAITPLGHMVYCQEYADRYQNNKREMK